MIFVELSPVVNIHAFFFEFLLLIPYASTLAAEPSNLTKINKNNVVLHITPMIFFVLHRHLPFPTWKAFFSLYSQVCFFSAIFIYRGIWRGSEEGSCHSRSCQEANVGRALEGRGDTGAAVRFPPGSPNLPPLPGSLRQFSCALFRSQAGIQDIEQKASTTMPIPLVFPL